jgi:hypothetical protein
MRKSVASNEWSAAHSRLCCIGDDQLNLAIDDGNMPAYVGFIRIAASLPLCVATHSCYDISCNTFLFVQIQNLFHMHT